jgi:two-component system cell cycle sensor histidine kinase/response regulator CckA
MNTSIFGINAMLADMEPLLRRLTSDDIDVAYQQSAGLWRVELPTGKLEEVLLALAIDAVHAMGDRGVLRVSTANVTDPEGMKRGAYVRLSVSDTRRSVSSALASAVRGRGTREGLGVRLGIEVAEAAGGRLDLAPNPGGGVTVHLVLPRAASGEAEQPPEDPEAATGSATILVVEDDKLVMSATGQSLTRLGYSLLLAPSGEAALRQLESHPAPVHLMLTDIMMPGMDGLTLAREVKKLRPETRILYMSGYSEEALRMKDALDPQLALLEKPFTFKGLAAAVKKALGS